jgi:hypothetical protein
LYCLLLSDIFTLVTIILCVVMVYASFDSEVGCFSVARLLPFFFILSLFFGLLLLYVRADTVDGFVLSNRFYRMGKKLTLAATLIGVPTLVVISLFFWSGKRIPEGPNWCIMVGDAILNYLVLGLGTVISLAYMALFAFPVYYHLWKLRSMRSSEAESGPARAMRLVASKNLKLSSIALTLTVADMAFMAWVNGVQASGDPRVDHLEVIAMTIGCADLTMNSIIFHVLVSTWMPTRLRVILKPNLSKHSTAVDAVNSNAGNSTAPVTHASTRIDRTRVAVSVDQVS